MNLLETIKYLNKRYDNIQEPFRMLVFFGILIPILFVFGLTSNAVIAFSIICIIIALVLLRGIYVVFL